MIFFFIVEQCISQIVEHFPSDELIFRAFSINLLDCHKTCNTQQFAAFCDAVFFDWTKHSERVYNL